MHELVLNGVGGCTIAEAKANLSYAEVLAWSAYRDKYGTLNVGRRMELSTAIIALQVNRGAGGKAELVDFMPHADAQALALEKAMAEWV
ncbi:phage tail assembly protein T [Pseudomonas sp. S3_A03]